MFANLAKGWVSQPWNARIYYSEIFGRHKTLHVHEYSHLVGVPWNAKNEENVVEKLEFS